MAPALRLDWPRCTRKNCEKPCSRSDVIDERTCQSNDKFWRRWVQVLLFRWTAIRSRHCSLLCRSRSGSLVALSPTLPRCYHQAIKRGTKTDGAKMTERAWKFKRESESGAPDGRGAGAEPRHGTHHHAQQHGEHAAGASAPPPRHDSARTTALRRLSTGEEDRRKRVQITERAAHALQGRSRRFKRSSTPAPRAEASPGRRQRTSTPPCLRPPPRPRVAGDTRQTDAVIASGPSRASCLAAPALDRGPARAVRKRARARARAVAPPPPAAERRGARARRRSRPRPARDARDQCAQATCNGANGFMSAAAAPHRAPTRDGAGSRSLRARPCGARTATSRVRPIDPPTPSPPRRGKSDRPWTPPRRAS